MSVEALNPPGAEAAAAQLKLSAGIAAGDFVFLTGMTGSRADGSMPTAPAEQFELAFAKIEAVLREAGLGMGRSLK